VTVHELSRVDACRIAVRAQLLDSARSAGLPDVVRHLALLQIDPTAAIAPNADLVAWSRLGPSYSPAAKRRWGYFALPVLYGDRLAGKLDATADRKAGVLRVNAIHQDVPFDKAMTAAVDHEIKDLAHWLELDLMPR
jgi:uncharacterized protein YcaQ